MICPKCGKELFDFVTVCSDCGYEFNKQSQQQSAPQHTAPSNNFAQQSYNAQPNYNQQANNAQPNYNQQPNNTPPPVYPQTVQTIINQPQAPIPSIGEYIGWSILLMIPIVNFIITIVFAADKTSHPARANYFRAIIVVWVIVIALIALTWLLFGTVLLGLFSEMGAPISYYF